MLDYYDIIAQMIVVTQFQKILPTPKIVSDELLAANYSTFPVEFTDSDQLLTEKFMDMPFMETLGLIYDTAYKALYVGPHPDVVDVPGAVMVPPDSLEKFCSEFIRQVDERTDDPLNANKIYEVSLKVYCIEPGQSIRMDYHHDNDQGRRFKDTKVTLLEIDPCHAIQPQIWLQVCNLRDAPYQPDAQASKPGLKVPQTCLRSENDGDVILDYMDRMAIEFNDTFFHHRPKSLLNETEESIIRFLVTVDRYDRDQSGADSG